MMPKGPYTEDTIGDHPEMLYATVADGDLPETVHTFLASKALAPLRAFAIIRGGLGFMLGGRLVGKIRRESPPRHSSAGTLLQMVGLF